MADEGGGGNVFTRKLGPLPMWAWMGIALAIALVYYFWEKNKSSSSTSSTDTSENTPGGVDSSLVPQFVNQTYVNNTPPAAPTTTGAQPAYGAAGPPNANYQAISVADAKTLESNKNTYNASGGKSQRPYIWNGSAYVPNTNPINSKYQYYAGPLEAKEINAATKSTGSSAPPASKSTPKTTVKKSTKGKDVPVKS
jgi:hypothetical protein